MPTSRHAPPSPPPPSLPYCTAECVSTVLGFIQVRCCLSVYLTGCCCARCRYRFQKQKEKRQKSKMMMTANQ